MASPIERLPTELLDVIIAQLAVADLAHLAQCSKRLHHRIEPVLYAPQAALDRVMYWACKNGQLSTIRLAVAYGADVSIVKVSMSHPTRGYDGRVSRPSNPRQTPQIPVLTLYLAARHVHTDAFALLLELGAHIDNSTGDAHVERFFQRLSRNQTLLDHFLIAGLGPEVREHGFYRSSLVSIIMCGGSVNLVRQVLNNGADIKQLRSTDPSKRIGKRIAYRTPLTAAIGVNSMPVFDFLVARGADIHGERVMCIDLSTNVLHIPMFAAAHAIPEHGFGMMQRCLDLNVNIDHWYQGLMTPGRYPGRYYLDNYTPAPTLLKVYLDAIDPRKDRMKLPSVDGLAFMFKQHVHIYDKKFPAVDFLLDKWGLKTLAIPQFCAVITFLLENGVSPQIDISWFLRKYESNKLCLPKSKIIKEPILHAWRNIVTLLLKKQEETDSLDESLVDYIRYWIALGAWERCTVDCLLEAGANINVTYPPHGRTILHDVALALHNSRKISVQVVLSVFEFLVDRGADPTIVVKRQTAVDILRYAIKTARSIEGREEHLLRLDKFLKVNPSTRPGGSLELRGRFSMFASWVKNKRL